MTTTTDHEEALRLINYWIDGGTDIADQADLASPQAVGIQWAVLDSSTSAFWE
ncbi:hypothetical protein [Corynebacterium cystitidis]|uniref:hypothetical protein n=1 Tax=Corynebacterium cystitidis TaxID=35757 RepID=UPI0012FE47E9|nr:hypothetical protein [Corynebacterium cystitidis]